MQLLEQNFVVMFLIGLFDEIGGACRSMGYTNGELEKKRNVCTGNTPKAVQVHHK